MVQRWKGYQQLVTGLALLTLGGSLLSCGPTETADAPDPTEDAAETTAEDSAPAELETVSFTLSWLLQGVDAPLTTAIERGYFADQGIEVAFDRGFGSADSITKIAAGQYDIGEGDLYAMMEFNQENPDTPLVAVAMKYSRSPLAVVSLAESGLAEPTDLDSASMGAPAGDAARRLWPVFSDLVGVDGDSVDWVNVEPRLRETLLVQGDYDAIACFSITCLPALDVLGFGEDEVNVFYYNDFGLELYGNALIVRQDFLDENPELVEGFVAAYLAGMQDTLSDPDGAFDTVAAFAEGDLFDPEVERVRLDLAIETLYTSDETDEVGLGAVDPDRLATTLEQAATGFGLSDVPEADLVFNPNFLPPLDERTL